MAPPPIFPAINESVNVSFQVTFPNRIIMTDNGAEQRIVPHQSPIRTYTLVKKIASSSVIAEVFDFYASLSGAFTPFAYLDRSDCIATAEYNDLGGGVMTRGLVVKLGDEFQLCKEYKCGSNIHYRPVYWATNLTVYNGSIPIEDITILPEGKLEGSGLTANTYPAEFIFYTKVRFGDDQVTRRLESSKQPAVYSINQVTLVEVKQELSPGLSDSFSNSVGIVFDPDRRNAISSSFTTKIKQLTSGYEVRESRSLEMPFVEFGEINLADEGVLEYLLAVWLNVKGSGAAWFFRDDQDQNILARFQQSGETESSLNYTLKIGGQDKYYAVESLSARLFYGGTINPGSYNGWTGSVLTLCDCVLLSTEEDSWEDKGFTNHDRPLVINDNLYSASEGVSISAMESTSNLDPNNVEITGVQGSISRASLFSRMPVDVEIKTIKGVNWRSPTDNGAAVKIQKGKAGRVTVLGQESWVIEVQDSIKRQLSRPLIRATSPVCDHRFCDADCRLDKASFTFDATVTGVTSNLSFTVSNSSDFSFGVITFNTGENAGLSFGIGVSNSGAIRLADIPEGLVEVGNEVTLFRGCEKTIEACQAYGNLPNFGGIPTGGGWMPGSDKYQNPGIRR